MRRMTLAVVIFLSAFPALATDMVLTALPLGGISYTTGTAVFNTSISGTNLSSASLGTGKLLAINTVTSGPYMVNAPVSVDYAATAGSATTAASLSATLPTNRGGTGTATAPGVNQIPVGTAAGTSVWTPVSTVLGLGAASDLSATTVTASTALRAGAAGVDAYTLYGANPLQNGDFATNTNGWYSSPGGAYIWDAGTAYFPGVWNNTAAKLIQNTTITWGTTYTLSFDMSTDYAYSDYDQLYSYKICATMDRGGAGYETLWISDWISTTGTLVHYTTQITATNNYHQNGTTLELSVGWANNPRFDNISITTSTLVPAVASNWKLYVDATSATIPTIHGVTDFLTTPTIAGTQMTFGGGTAALPAHNDTTSIQGGAAGDYYHLTSAQRTVATQAATGSVAGYLAAADWTTFNGKVSSPWAVAGSAISYSSGVVSIGAATTGKGRFEATSTVDTTASIYALNSAAPSSTILTPTAIKGEVTGAVGAGQNTRAIYGLNSSAPTNSQIGLIIGVMGEVTGAGQAGGAVAGVYGKGGGSGSYAIYSAGPQYSTTANVWTYASDRRLKKNIFPMEDALPRIMCLRPSEYEYDAIAYRDLLGDDVDGSKHHKGFIAQDIREVYPDMVSERIGKDGAPVLVLNTSGLDAEIVKAIQEQQAQIVQMRLEIASLRYDLQIVKDKNKIAQSEPEPKPESDGRTVPPFLTRMLGEGF